MSDKKSVAPTITLAVIIVFVVLLFAFPSLINLSNFDTSPEIRSSDYERLQKYIDDPIISTSIEWYVADGKITEIENRKLYEIIQKRKEIIEVEDVKKQRNFFFNHFISMKEKEDERKSSESTQEKRIRK